MQDPRLIDGFDLHLEDTGRRVLGDPVDHDPVKRPERPTVAVLQNGAFARPDPGARIRARGGSHELADRGGPGRHHLGGDLIGHRRRRGARSRAVAKHVQPRKADALDEGTRVGKLGFGLTGKPDDKVTGDAACRDLVPDAGDGLLEITRRVRTTHAGQGRAAAGLDGKMQERSDAVAMGRHAVDQLIRDVHRLNGRKANLGDARAAEDAFDEAHQSDRRFALGGGGVCAEVHPRENDLGDPGSIGGAHLLEDRPDRDAALGTTRLPYDAVGAPVVAAVLDLDPQPAAPEEALRVEAAGGRPIGNPRKQLADAVGHIDFRRFGDDARREVAQLVRMKVHDAPGHHDARTARKAQRMADRLAGLGLGFTGDGTGVDDDQVGRGLVDQGEAACGEVSADPVAFDAIDPATEVNDGNAGGVQDLPPNQACHRWRRECDRPRSSCARRRRPRPPRSARAPRAERR